MEAYCCECRQIAKRRIASEPSSKIPRGKNLPLTASATAGSTHRTSAVLAGAKTTDFRTVVRTEPMASTTKFVRKVEAAPVLAEHAHITIEEVAEILKVSVSWVYERTRRRSADRIPGFRLGKYWRFRETDVLAWIEMAATRSSPKCLIGRVDSMPRRERAREPTERSPLFAADTREFVCLSVATRGIRIGNRHPMTETLYLNPSEVRRLLTSLCEPSRTLVLVGVLTGIRIGEILALRWKHLDLLRGTIQVRETVSEGQFGSPKTRSSRRDVPMSDPVQKAFEVQRTRARQMGAGNLVFATRKQTPPNPRNLLRRVKL